MADESAPSTAEAAEAAATLRRLLAAVEAGDIDAPPGRGTSMQRRLEGAAAALHALSETQEGVREPWPDQR